MMSPEEREARYREVRRMHVGALRSRRIGAMVYPFCIAGLVGAIVWQGHSNAILAEKASQTQVVYGIIRGDGEIVNSARFTSLPVRDQTNVTINALWTYIQSRECYNETTAARDWHIVTSMSDRYIAKQFADWFEQQNKDSPQHVYGDKHVRIECALVSYAPLGPNRYMFRFNRSEVSQSGASDPVIYAVSLQYRTGIFSTDPRAWIDRATFNAPGVQITDYPSAARPEGAAHQEAAR